MRPLTLVSALTAALAVLPLTLASAQQEAPPLPLGSKAPAFHTTSLSGKPLSLTALRGHVVLLDYWATWCGPCRMATPTLESLHQKFGKRGLRVIGISVDDASTVAQVPAFARMMHMTYTLSASPQANSQAGRLYHANGIPAQYLIDKRGIVRWAQEGFDPSEGAKLSALIQKLLAEKA